MEPPPADDKVAMSAVTSLSDDESFRKPYTLPKILDGKFYKDIQPNLKTPGAIQAICTSCCVLISGTTKSTGNFLSHIKRRHKELLPLCQLYCQAKSNGSVAATKNPVPVSTSLTAASVTDPVQETVATVAPVVTYPTAPATHLAMPMTVPVPVPFRTMSLAMPLSLPNVQTPQMMALMQQYQTHDSMFIKKD